MHGHLPEQIRHTSDCTTRVLIVDDDATMRLLMRETLQDEGYIIDEADNGIDAMQMIKAVPPDLVLLDVRMPGISGFDVCDEIREFSGDTNIAVVMVTGLEDAESIEKAFQLGATAFISKPINWVTFPYRIQYILKARSAFAELQQREIHLRHLDRISRIVVQNKHIDIILQELLFAMLDIFNCDRAFIIKKHDDSPAALSIDHEVCRKQLGSIKQQIPTLISEMGNNIFYRADTTEYPVVSSFNEVQIRHSQLRIHQQMLHALRLNQPEQWYLAVQQCQSGKPWNNTDHETFYRACLRLSGMLSSHLLLEKLHDSEQLLQQAQRIGKLGNWHWDSKTGRLTWSAEMYRILGYRNNSFSPDFNTCYRIAFDEDRDLLLQHRDKAIKNGTAYSIEYRIRLPDESIVWLHEHGVCTLHEDQARSISGTLQDITDRRKKQEQELHNQKMDAIGQLTSGVAHDFGNLMTVAKGNLELLQDILDRQHQIDDDTREILHDARSAIQDGVELTRQLLAFSRKKSISPEYVNIKDKLEQFFKLLKHTLSDNIRLSMQVEDGLPDILVDAVQLETSLLNLCINARNAMPNGGELEISARLCHCGLADDKHSICDIDDSCIDIAIRDTGTGMTEDIIEHAIEPFFTTNKNEGTGLGLSMVYGFMRQSKGELKIDSQPGTGTTMHLRFPVYGGAVEPSRQEKSADVTPIKHSTILIVEDRDTVRQFAVRCLSQLGINLLLASDAEQAQALLCEDHSIDLLFTDIVMPGELNGRELAKWTRQHYPNIRILLTTASEKQLHYQPAGDEPVYLLIPKPYSKQELIKAIYAALS